MKLNRIKRRSSGNLILELTPLIDVVFLLLIFFLVATKFEDINSNIKIDLPTSTLKTSELTSELQVIVSANKEYYVTYTKDGKKLEQQVSKLELKNKLEEILKTSQDKVVVISADKNIDHGTIVDIMTISKEAGAISLDIDTASPKK